MGKNAIYDSGQADMFVKKVDLQVHKKRPDRNQVFCTNVIALPGVFKKLEKEACPFL